MENTGEMPENTGEMPENTGDIRENTANAAACADDQAETKTKTLPTAGIITFHAAYNFGSALQAYALQEAVKRAGCRAKIINYRLKEQKRYDSLLRPWYGPVTFANDVARLPVLSGRLAGRKRFRRFMQQFMRLTDEFDDPQEAPNCSNEFDLVISGSDQIWNRRVFGLENRSLFYMFPYLLRGVTKPKFSYASSVSNITDDELERLAPYLRRFRAVSVHESSSAMRVRKATGMAVETVLDPILLFPGDEWRRMMHLNDSSRPSGILYYSLGGFRAIRQIRPLLSKLAAAAGERVTVLTPNCHMIWKKDDPFDNHPEFGPVEFLNALCAARLIVTDSYYGTILAANLNRPFYSIVNGGESDLRKSDIMEALGLSGRMIRGDTGVRDLPDTEIRFGPVNQALELLRENSWNYLKNTIRECTGSDV